MSLLAAQLYCLFTPCCGSNVTFGSNVNVETWLGKLPRRGGIRSEWPPETTDTEGCNCWGVWTLVSFQWRLNVLSALADPFQVCGRPRSTVFISVVLITHLSCWVRALDLTQPRDVTLISSDYWHDNRGNYRQLAPLKIRHKTSRIKGKRLT